MVWHATIRLAFVGETHHDIFYATLVIIMFHKKLVKKHLFSAILMDKLTCLGYLVEIEIRNLLEHL